VKTAYIDTNVIVRFLTGDPPDMAQQAEVLFAAADHGEMILILDDIVLAETVWVLSSFYGHSTPDIARTLSELLAHEAIEAQDKEILVEALSLFADYHVDFADALVVARMRRRGINEVFSFDSHFDRLPDVIRMEPATLGRQ
jgi:predicted nucleic acid-binding protein